MDASKKFVKAMQRIRQEKLEKSAKAGLVQVQRQVSKNGRTFTQHFWIKPGDVKPTDVVLNQPQQGAQQPKAQAAPAQPGNPKTMIVGLLSSHGRDALMAHAKANGVAWKENANPGINWMRASMAIQKHMTSNPGVWDAAKIGNSSTDKAGQQSIQPDDKKQQGAQPTQQSDSKPDKTPAKDDKAPPAPDKGDQAASKAPDQPKATKVKTSDDAKKKVKELAGATGKDKLMETAKKNGVTWNESDKPAINWMRASMAIAAALTADPDKLAADTVQADLKTTQAKVKQLEDLVSKIQQTQQQPTAQQVSAQQQQVDVLKGLTTDFITDHEKKEFGTDLSKATPEQFMRARTLGMVAGDDAAADYLERLYDQYVKALTAPDPMSNPNNSDVDPLKNKLIGVVNRQIVGSVKSSLSKIRTKVGQHTIKQRMLEPWIDPNTPLSDAEKDYLRQNFVGGIALGSARQAAMKEKDGSHGMLKRCLDKLAMTQEYGQLAMEYKAILEQYDALTEADPFIQTITGNASNKTVKQYASDLDYQVKMAQDRLNKANQALIDNDKAWPPSDKIDAAMADPNSKYYINPSWDKAAQEDKRAVWRKEAQRFYDGYHKRRLDEIKAAQAEVDKWSAFQKKWEGNLDKLVQAGQLRETLFQSQFVDLNANLWHIKMMGVQLANSYFIEKDFVAEYPVLSKANLDVLEKGDETALTNLALYVGMFKPSLTKGGKNAQDVILEKYQERQELLKTYGGVTAVQGAPQYSENNEIKCRVSKVSDQTAKEITANIARDWDQKTHGRMRYQIKGIYEVSGLTADTEFQKIRQSHKNGDVTSKLRSSGSMPKRTDSDFFYHGTGAMATSLILGHSGEFRVVKAKVGRMLGNGIYLADKASKSAQYISDSGYSRNGTKGSLMIVEASLGSVCGRDERHKWSACDTVFAGTEHGVLNNEWCVHNPKAVIPRYLVEMEVL